MTTYSSKTLMCVFSKLKFGVLATVACKASHTTEQTYVYVTELCGEDSAHITLL